MSYIYDFDEIRRRCDIEERLKRDGKCCPKCKQYRLFDSPRKGTSKGYCLLRTGDHPLNPTRWGTSLTHVCYKFEEVENASNN